jgi:hypothetical protein
MGGGIWEKEDWTESSTGDAEVRPYVSHVTGTYFRALRAHYSKYSSLSAGRTVY